MNRIYDPDNYQPAYHAGFPGGERRTTAMSRSRSQSTRSHRSSIDSTSSNSDFLAHRDDGRPIVTGFDYGPYSYLAQPQAMERQRTYDTQQYASSSMGHASGSGSGRANLLQAPSGAGPISSSFRPPSISSQATYQNPGEGFPVGGNYPHGLYATANNFSDTYFLYDTKEAESDDYMHTITPHDAIMERRSCTFSWRGLLNVFALVVIILVLLAMFAAYPIVSQIYQAAMQRNGAWGLGGTNSTGQVPCRLLL